MRNIFISLILSGMLAGCQQQEIPTYSGEEYVQFFDKENDAYKALNETFSFCYSGSDAIQDTVFLDVVISGKSADYDRKISLRQTGEYKFEYNYDEDGVVTDSTLVEVENQAIPDVHYVPFDKPEAAALLWLEKGKVEGKIGIILKRDVSLQAEDFNLNVEIVANEDFEVGDVSSIKAKIVIMDRLSRPNGWNNASYYPGYNPDYSSFWGIYGPVKHQFMIDYSPAGERWDDDFLEELNKDEGRMFWYASFFSRKLNEVNQARADQGLDPLCEDPNNPDSKVEFTR